MAGAFAREDGHAPAGAQQLDRRGETDDACSDHGYVRRHGRIVRDELGGGAVDCAQVTSKGSVAERFAIVAICFGYLTLMSLSAVMTGQRNFEYTTEAMAGMLVLEVVLAAIAGAILLRRGWTATDFRLDISLRSTLGAIALFAATMVACNVVYLVMFHSGALLGWTQAGVKITAAPALVLLFLVVNSAFEEFFVTAYLIDAGQSGGIAYAVSISTVVRLLYHTYQGPVAFASIVPIGLLFGAVYARHRNLWTIVAAHTFINLYSWMAT